MVKHTQTIRRQQQKNCLSAFDHFAGLPLKRLIVVWLNWAMIILYQTFRNIKDTGFIKDAGICKVR